MKSLFLMAALAAAPAFAQSPPAPPQTPQPPRVQVYDTRGYGPGMPGPGQRGMRAWANISPEGRDTLRDALRPDREVDRAQVKAARDRVQELMAADRLDVAALRRAMEDENRLVDAMRDKRRAALLAAVQRLSVEDRKAFAERAQMGRDRMSRRVQVYRYRGEGPTPPAPPAPVPPAN